MNNSRKLVVVITNGLDDERSSVAWSIANGGIAAGHEVSIFLVASGVDWVRKGAADFAHPNPLDPPMKEMIQNVIENGSAISVCPPCAKLRGYTEESFIEGVKIAGSMAIHEPVGKGAAVLTF